MRFLCLYKPAEAEGTAPQPDEMMKMGQLINEMTQAGVLLATEGCLPSVKGARVRRENGTFTVTDGPFTESKELVAGFAIIQAASKAEAVHWAKRFLEVAGDGESEIREVNEMPDCAPQALDVHETAARL